MPNGIVQPPGISRGFVDIDIAGSMVCEKARLLRAQKSRRHDRIWEVECQTPDMSNGH